MNRKKIKLTACLVAFLVYSPFSFSRAEEPTDPADRIDQVVDLMASGKNEQALSEIDSILRVEPQATKLRILRGEILLALQRAGEVPSELAKIPKKEQGPEYWSLSLLTYEQLLKTSSNEPKAKHLASLHQSVAKLLGFRAQFIPLKPTVERVLKDHPNTSLQREYCRLHRKHSKDPCAFDTATKK